MEFDEDGKIIWDDTEQPPLENKEQTPWEDTEQQPLENKEQTPWDDTEMPPWDDNELPPWDISVRPSRKKKQPPEGNNAQPSSKMELYDWLQCIVTSVLALILIFVFVARIITVDGTSMLPTLYHTDKVVVSNLFYKPQDGDIVIIKTDAFGATPLVKRVIASGGETVDINFTTHEVRVNDIVLDEEWYINEPTSRSIDFEGPVSVPEGYLFVMGDNRNNSTDSRSAMVGFIDVRDVIGKVRFIIVPGPNEFGLRQWNRVGSAYKKR